MDCLGQRLTRLCPQESIDMGRPRKAEIGTVIRVHNKDTGDSYAATIVNYDELANPHYFVVPTDTLGRLKSEYRQVDASEFEVIQPVRQSYPRVRDYRRSEREQ